MSLVKNDDLMNDEIHVLHARLRAEMGQQQVQGETLIMVQEYHEMTIRVSAQQAWTHRSPPCHLNTKRVKPMANLVRSRESSNGSKLEEGSAEQWEPRRENMVKSRNSTKANHSEAIEPTPSSDVSDDKNNRKRHDLQQAQVYINPLIEKPGGARASRAREMKYDAKYDTSAK
ncbi:hypothetical protein Tco_0510419 [Tanacetum coccineum]